jgi:hypothetical protein
MMDLHPEVAKAAPGAVGALVALRWMRGTTWLHTVSSFIGGCALSYYGTAHAVKWSGADPGLSGFVLGLFGMAVVAKVFEAMEQFKAAETLGKLLAKWGL